MSRRKSTEIFSIFGQIDAVVAKAMVDEGKANLITQDTIPATALFDEAGRKAQFAVVMPMEHLNEFNERIRKLYA